MGEKAGRGRGRERERDYRVRDGVGWMRGGRIGHSIRYGRSDQKSRETPESVVTVVGQGTGEGHVV